VTVFAVNRGAESLGLEVVLRELDGVSVAEHLVLVDEDLAAGNSAEQPDRVVPSQGTGAAVEGGVLHATLAPRSWNVLRLAGGVLGAAA
jgi:alpha-N-arabinofuranosidase